VNHSLPFYPFLTFEQMEETGNYSQAAHAVFMVKPTYFGFNAETAASNAFQNKISADHNVQDDVLKEFEALVTTLRKHEIEVIVFDDTLEPLTPDAVFPNNWISMHQNGEVVLYPMLTPNRRLERRLDVVESLREKFAIDAVADLSEYEEQGHILEGTGSIIFDHIHRTAYACISLRTSVQLFQHVCEHLGYRPVSFRATDLNGKDIYHTNVMLTIGTGYAVICADAIEDTLERAMVLASFKKDGLKIIEISFQQVLQFAGNMLEVQNSNGDLFLVMSKQAFNCLTVEQKADLESFVKIIYSDIETIEHIGGGSVRCMLAGIHLPKK
jgi:hypothetical protein